MTGYWSRVTSHDKNGAGRPQGRLFYFPPLPFTLPSADASRCLRPPKQTPAHTFHPPPRLCRMPAFLFSITSRFTDHSANTPTFLRMLECYPASRWTLRPSNATGFGASSRHTKSAPRSSARGGPLTPGQGRRSELATSDQPPATAAPRLRDRLPFPACAAARFVLSFSWIQPRLESSPYGALGPHRSRAGAFYFGHVCTCRSRREMRVR